MNKERGKTYYFYLLILILILLISFVNSKEYIIEIKENKNQISLRSNSENSVINSIEKEKRSYNSFRANLTIEEYNKLKKEKNIIIYNSSQIFHATLDNSVNLINANDTWNLKENNINLTGVGQTVCVIDSGVYYTHSSLGGCYGNNDPNSNCKILGGYDFINDDSDPLDDNGHGTHVTGIISSNDSTYKGVAPDSKIISIKSLDNSGSGTQTEVSRGIEWCINNASRFNISVITMSLGTDTYYTNSCDNLFPLIRGNITNAINANISVIISSGNCENTTVYECYEGVSAPACYTGIIPVGAVNDADSIFYQRGPLFQVLAPGIGIISTKSGGGFESRSGTSMAAPHVAGLISIISQYFKSEYNNTIDNSTLINALNNTNDYINDTLNSGYLFPRVDVLKSLFYLDSSGPEINLTSPTNNTINASINYSFAASISDLKLKNITFYLWNSTTLINTSSENITSQSYNASNTVQNLQSGVYRWTYSSYDENNNLFTAQNFTLTVGGSVTLSSPSNDTYTNNSEQNFLCTSVTSPDLSLNNVTFKIFNSTGLLYNSTSSISGTSNTSTFNYTLNLEQDYTWNCSMYDNNSQLYNSNSRRIYYDNSTPNLTIISPLPQSETSNSVSRVFYYNISDNYNSTNCSLLFNNVPQETNLITSYNETKNFTATLTPGTYNWKINCSDRAGNINISSQNSFTITAVSSGGGGGSSGGGGGGGSSVSNIEGSENNPITSEEIRSGYKRLFKLYDKVYFKNSKEENHSIRLNEIIEGKVNLTIQSETIELILEQNSIKKLNLSSIQTLDLKITVGQITNSEVNITIEEINETNPLYKKVAEERIFFAMNESEKKDSSEEDEFKDNTNKIIFTYLILIIIVIFVIFSSNHFMKKNLNKENNKKNKNEKKENSKIKKE